jgi:hypothetical protein
VILIVETGFGASRTMGLDVPVDEVRMMAVVRPRDVKVLRR